MRSQIVDRIGKIEIGRYDSTEDFFPDLKRGKMLPIFHTDGKYAVEKHLLKIMDRGTAKEGAAFFRNIAASWSEPVAPLILRDVNDLRHSCGEVESEKREWELTHLISRTEVSKSWFEVWVD